MTAVEIKDVELPAPMQRAKVKQAEAEREKRAKVIHAEGELQASTQLAQAAGVFPYKDDGEVEACSPPLHHPCISL